MSKFESFIEQAQTRGFKFIGDIVAPCYRLDTGTAVVALVVFNNSIGINVRGKEQPYAEKALFNEVWAIGGNWLNGFKKFDEAKVLKKLDELIEATN